MQIALFLVVKMAYIWCVKARSQTKTKELTSVFPLACLMKYSRTSWGLFSTSLLSSCKISPSGLVKYKSTSMIVDLTTGSEDCRQGSTTPRISQLNNPFRILSFWGVPLWGNEWLRLMNSFKNWTRSLLLERVIVVDLSWPIKSFIKVSLFWIALISRVCVVVLPEGRCKCLLSGKTSSYLKPPWGFPRRAKERADRCPGYTVLCRLCGSSR